MMLDAKIIRYVQEHIFLKLPKYIKLNIWNHRGFYFPYEVGSEIFTVYFLLYRKLMAVPHSCTKETVNRQIIILVC